MSVLSVLPSNIRPQNRFNYIITLLVLVFGFTPFLTRVVSVIIYFAIYVLWFISTLTVTKRINWAGKHNIALWWSLLLLWQYFSYFFGLSTDNIHNVTARISVMMLPLLTLFVFTYYNDKEKKTLFNAALLILFLNLIDNIIIGVRDPLIFETLNKATSTDADFRTNAGSTAFVASFLFLIPVLILFLRKKGRFFYLTFALLASVFIFVINSRATAGSLMLLTLVMMFLIRMCYNEQTGLSKKKLVITSFLCFVLASVTILPFLQSIESYVEDSSTMAGRLTERIEDLISVISARSIDYASEGSLVHRVMLYTVSLESFTSSASSLIWGIGEKAHGTDLSSLIDSGVGGHSEIFDTLAMFGGIGGILLLIAFNKTFKYVKCLFSGIYVYYIYPIEIIFFIYSCLNRTLIQSIILVVFLILPLSSVFLCNTIKNDKYVY